MLQEKRTWEGRIQESRIQENSAHCARHRRILHRRAGQQGSKHYSRGL
jgi:hypothetical protein